MRGKGNVPGDKLGATRITPAYAGKSSTAPMIPTGGWDHPRVCGEKQMADQWATRIEGSPPRMRGKVTHTGAIKFSTGITPAYAGKSRPCRWALTRPRDHPRVCGEKYQAGEAQRQSQGSPPRMRGKAEIESYADECDRITPAYAGKRFVSTLCRCVRWDHPRVCGEKLVAPLVAARIGGSPPRMRGKDNLPFCFAAL